MNKIIGGFITSPISKPKPKFEDSIVGIIMVIISLFVGVCAGIVSMYVVATYTYEENEAFIRKFDNKIEIATDKCAPLCDNDKDYQFWTKQKEIIIDKLENK